MFAELEVTETEPGVKVIQQQTLQNRLPLRQVHKLQFRFS